MIGRIGRVAHEIQGQMRGTTPSDEFPKFTVGSNLSPLDLKVYPLDLPDLFKGFRGKVAP